MGMWDCNLNALCSLKALNSLLIEVFLIFTTHFSHIAMWKSFYLIFMGTLVINNPWCIYVLKVLSNIFIISYLRIPKSTTFHNFELNDTWYLNLRVQHRKVFYFWTRNLFIQIFMFYNEVSDKKMLLRIFFSNVLGKHNQT